MTIFDPLQNRHPSIDHQKFVAGHYVGDPYSHRAKLDAHPSTGASGRMGEISPIFFIYSLLGTHLQVRLVDRFSRMIVEMTCTRAGMCLLGCRWYGSPFRGQISQTPILGAWIGVFKPNSRNLKHAYYQHYCVDSNQILHSDKDHQTPFMGGLSTRTTNLRWQTAAILEK